ncbi:MAG: UDP-N-acetylglucosamine--N-acetylmuramyl-(pentapeptide) pyrophosphoryl-undecaprenol N-acetylglucosamine transferase, partial [Synergistota bacterium]|nr:UDP-N-acetylglucosamine--N-acetylmuramyl-(pentapeptide) pyrophosphoryl-undecaprenol N-acetylglucosamine transferase [Synergistota bacterium]
MLRLLARWKPEACVLFGGYVSFPALAACLILSVPVLVHEQNAKAGKITRIASFFRTPVCSGWKTCEHLKKKCFEHTGVPVRIFGNLLPEEAWIKLEYGVECPRSPRILVLGGSLASDRLASLVRDVSRIDKFRTWTFLFPGASDIWKPEGENCWLGPRMWEMDALFSLADIVITRCGASTLAEIENLGIPAILVPWPDAADDHQTANARAFTEINGAPIVNEKEISAELLGETLLAVYYSGKNEQALSCTGKNSADKAVMKLWNAIRHITEGRDRN